MTLGAPDGVVVDALGLAAVADQALADLFVPLDPAQRFQFPLQGLLEGKEVTHVIQRVVDHGRRQRAAPPIGFLGSLFERDAQMGVQGVIEPETGLTHDPGRQHRVEDAPGFEMMSAEEQAQIVVGRVEDDAVPFHGLPQGLQVQIGQGIH